jgi:oxygen-dependent protoporphyrinogen oxidase
MKKIAIIGAGITGLTAAYEILNQKENLPEPVEVKVFEKGRRPGGVFATEKIGGFLIEGGPDSFELYKPAPLELARELGIESEVIDANEENHITYLYINGKLQEIPRGLLGLIPQNLMQLAFCPYLSLKAKARAALEIFVPLVTEGDKDLSIAEFYIRRFGREVFENVAEPLFGSIYACIPETISLKSCWPRGMELEKENGSLLLGMLKRRREAKKNKNNSKKAASMFKSFKNGMSQLVDAILRKLPEGTIEYGKDVRTIKKSGSGYIIEFEDGSHSEADICIIATSPSYATAKIVREIDSAIADMLLRIPFASSATVSLAFKKDEFGHPLNGFGFLVPRKEGTTIKASTWSSTKFSGRAPEDGVLIRCFVGNAQEETIVYKEDDEILEAVFKDLKKMMNVDAKPLFYRIYRWFNAMPQFTIGHSQRVKFIEEREERHPGLFLVGNAYRGLGVGDCINDGRRAARKAVEHLSRSTLAGNTTLR